MDSVSSNVMNVTLLFSGNSNDFINYPYVSLITDINADTVGTSTMNFFGQFGNTSQTYAVNTNLDSIPTNFNYTVYFNYDTSVCALAYPCLSSSIDESYAFFEFKIYPNPFITETVLQSDKFLKNATLTVYNSFGQSVKQIKHISGHTVTLQRENIRSGLYFIKMTENNKLILDDKIVITD